MKLPIQRICLRTLAVHFT